MPDYSEIEKAFGGDVDVEGSFGRFNPRTYGAKGGVQPSAVFARRDEERFVKTS
jgi:hypothetical protein